jgi:2-polyprenyl-3-methyl-5-hydroxy-6-metoxy-1,4-benzoquinol methylase
MKIPSLVKDAYYNLKFEAQVKLNRKPANAAQRGHWRHMVTTERYDPANYGTLDKQRWRIHMWEDLVKGLNLKGKAVLDYGCANGVWSRRYAGLGADVTGIDYANPPNYPYSLIHADITEFQAPGKADLIHTTDVLQHLEPEKQDKALALMHRNLKPNGHILIIETSGDTSIHIFPRNWVEAVKQCGFKPVRTVENDNGRGLVQGLLAKKAEQ